MATLKQSVSVNGRVLSNNDPDLEIKLDSHEAVQISSIQEDSITFSFTGMITPNVVYKLNLTFTYKGNLTKVVPLELTHNATTLTAKVVGSTELKSSEYNVVYFDVVDQHDKPITGLEVDGSLGLNVEPRIATNQGDSGKFSPDSKVPGRYWYSITLGPKGVELTATPEVKHGAYKAKLNPLVYTSVEQPVVSLCSPDRIPVNTDTEVTVYLSQKRPVSGGDPEMTLVSGTFESQVPGPNTLITQPFVPKEGSPGYYVGRVKADTVGITAQFKFTIVEEYGVAKNEVRWVDVMNGVFITPPPVLAVPNPDTIYNDPEPQNVALTLTLDGQYLDGNIGLLEVTSGPATLNTTAPIFVNGGRVDISLTPSGVGEVVLNGVIYGRNGEDYGNFTFKVNVVKSAWFDVTGTSTANLRVGEERQLVFRPTYDNVPVAKTVSIDEATSELPSFVKIIDRKALNDEEYAVTIQGTQNNKIGTVKFNFFVNGTDPRGPEGRGNRIANTRVTVLGALTLVSNSASVSANTGKTVKINLAIKSDEDNIPINTKDLVITTKQPTEVEVMGSVADGFTIKSLWEPDQAFNTRETDFTVTYLGQTVDFKVKVRHVSNNPQPTVEVIGKIEGGLGDKGKIPIKVTSNMTPGLDLTPDVNSYEFFAKNDYISLDKLGNWEIIKDPGIMTPGTSRVDIRIPEQSMYWSNNVNIEYVIGTISGPHVSDLVKEYEMDLWETTPVSFKVLAGDADITTSVTDVVCTNATQMASQFEFVKISDTSWGFKSIKSDPEAWQKNIASLLIKVTHEGKDYELPAEVTIKTKPNDGRIPTERFNVEVL